MYFFWCFTTAGVSKRSHFGIIFLPQSSEGERTFLASSVVSMQPRRRCSVGTWRVDLTNISRLLVAWFACFKFQVSWKWWDLLLFRRNGTSAISIENTRAWAFLRLANLIVSKQEQVHKHFWNDWMDEKMFTCNSQGCNLHFCRAHLLH